MNIGLTQSLISMNFLIWLGIVNHKMHLTMIAQPVNVTKTEALSTQSL